MEGAAQRTWLWAVEDLEAAAPIWHEGELTVGAVTVHTVHAAADNRELKRTIVQRPDEWDPATIWLTTVDVVRDGECVEVGISVEQDMRHHRVPPSPLLPPFVQLLHDLVDRGARVGSQRVRPTAQAVIGSDQVGTLVDRVLLAPDRRLPVVLFTAIKEQDGSYPVDAGDPALAARELCGLAHVYVIPRAEDTHRLTRRLGMLSAYDGAVRIYWPRFRLSDPPPRHPLHLRQRLNPSSGPAIIRRVVEAGARSYRPPDGTAALLATRWRQREHVRIAEALAGEPDPTRQVATLRDELFHSIDATVGLEHEIESLHRELVRANQRVDELETELAAARQAVDLEGRSHRQAGAAPAPPPGGEAAAG